MNKLLITAHILVKNEEIFIKDSIMSVLPFVNKIIIFDTGSIDNTIKRIKEIKSKKIIFYKKIANTPKDLTNLRNKMIQLTKTKYFLIVDGDEIYSQIELKEVIHELKNNTSSFYRITLKRADFINSRLLRSRITQIGKIFRTDGAKFVQDYPYEKVISSKSKNSIHLGDQLMIYHYCYFKRSKNDNTKIRYWRSLPFPIVIGAETANLAKSNLLIDLLYLPILNIISIIQKSKA